jgi:hypothetical protein
VSLDVAVSSELSLVFPTPILLRTLFSGPFHERLARTVLACRRRGLGGRVSGGGWQSPSDVLDWPDLEVKLLFSEVVEVVQRMCAVPGKVGEANPSPIFATQQLQVGPPDSELEKPGVKRTPKGSPPYHACAWANVNGDGHYNPLRVQAGYHWCAIYHVSMEGRPRTV